MQQWQSLPSRAIDRDTDLVAGGDGYLKFESNERSVRDLLIAKYRPKRAGPLAPRKRKITMISIVTRGSPELLPLHGGRTPASCADINRKAANWVLAAARSAVMCALQKSRPALLHAWRARQVERVFLEGLHDFELREMGFTREARRREMSKPFWRA
jgi:uncharacterized protein YjiS (DUF1127 family)